MSLPETQKIIQGDENGQPIFKEVPLPKPSQNQVTVKIEFTPINPVDLARLAGFNGGSDSIGSEASGIIVAVGENLKIPHKIGDRVHVTGPGTFGQYLVTSSENCFPILYDDLSLEDAASHYINPATVYFMGVLADQGGHKAAIHTAGASALGRMFIKYFKMKGIKTINVVRRDEYIEELKKEGADYVLNSKAPDFEKQFKEIAHKENATIAFDAISGEFTNVVLKCQPTNSICYISGVLEGAELNKISVLELLNKKKIGGLYLFRELEDLNEEETQKVFKEVHKLIPTAFKSNIYEVFPMDKIKEAIDVALKNASKGKVLLKPN